MMSQKKFANAAERQRAHRQRLRERLAGLAPAPAAPKSIRKPSRPTRLARVAEELQTLTDEYQNWFENIPDNLAGGDTAARLEETVAHLQAALEEIDQADPPRGYGR